MGQSCSSEKNKLKNKASQKKKNESVSHNYKENTNDHYIKENIAIPHQVIPQEEHKIPYEKPDNIDIPKQQNHLENGIEQMKKRHINHLDDEKDKLEFSQAKAKQDNSFEKEKVGFENESGKGDKKINPQYDDNAYYENNGPQSYEKKAKDDDSFEEERKENNNSNDPYDENLGNRPHHFRHLQKEEGQNAEIDCPICLESFVALGEEPTFTICGHAFCSKCLKGALKIHPYCPLCRAYQSEPLQDAQAQQVYGLNNEGPIEPLPQGEWNVEVVRAHLREISDEEGNFNRRVYLSNGEPTNIYVGRGAKINVSPNANLFINGKRVENPQDCNVQ